MSNPACIDSFGRPTFGDERRLGEFGADFREHVLPGADLYGLPVHAAMMPWPDSTKNVHPAFFRRYPDVGL